MIHFYLTYYGFTFLLIVTNRSSNDSPTVAERGAVTFFRCVYHVFPCARFNLTHNVPITYSLCYSLDELRLRLPDFWLLPNGWMILVLLCQSRWILVTWIVHSRRLFRETGRQDKKGWRDIAVKIPLYHSCIINKGNDNLNARRCPTF